MLMGSSGIDAQQRSVTEILQLICKLGPEFTHMIWGSPGIGKTEATKAAFGKIMKETGLAEYEIVLVLAGCSEPTDISGVPFEYKHKGEAVATQILAPIWAWHASVEAPPEFINRKMVIFFDDIVTGHEQTQAACFKVFGEKKVGNLQLRDNVFIVAAGNRVEDKSAAFEMPMALANRMHHWYAHSDVDAWVTWAIEEGAIHPLMNAYIRANPNDLNLFAKVLEDASSEKAFPTPRTWEMLSKSMYKMDPTGAVSGDWLYNIASGCIGAGVGMKFTTFAKNTTSMIAPVDICKHPDTARIPDKKEIDVLYATVSALEHYINQPQHYECWDKALQYVLRDEMQAEFGLLVAKMATQVALSKLDEKGRVAATSNPWFQKMYKQYGTLIVNHEA
jgi:hypothetical protein